MISFTDVWTSTMSFVVPRRRWRARERRSSVSAPGSRAAPRPRRLRRVLLWSLSVALLVVIGGSLWLLRDPRPYFDQRRSPLAAVEAGEAQRSSGHVSQSVRLRAENGLTAELLLRFPDSVRGDSGLIVSEGAAGATLVRNGARRPVFLILGGYRTGERAATLVEDTHGAIVAALSYPYEGPLNPKGLDVLPLVPAIRRAIMDTPPTILLAVEYFRSRPDVDPSRVELVGASFGAPFASIAAVLDAGISRLWLVHAAGRPYQLIDHGLKKSIPFPPARWLVAGIANVFANGPRLTSENWVPDVAPRPVIMINASEDERLPREAIEALHESAREPNEVIWLPGQHVQSNREAVIRGLVETVLDRAARP